MLVIFVWLCVEILLGTVEANPVCSTQPLPFCEPRNLSITVDNTLRIFIDGVETTGLPNAYDWTKADRVKLPCYAKVIAVLATDDGAVRAGILASTDDGDILTNDAWICSSVYQRGWEAVDFDDSSWPSARVIAVHQTYTCPWDTIQGIRSDAYWIWTDNFIRDITGDRVIYCRLNLDLSPLLANSPPPCPSRDLSVTVDNIMRLFIDGVERTGLPNANDWTKSDTVPLPWSTQVIAVQGRDDGLIRAGILASTGDGYILTNASWKCTSEYHRGWERVEFNDADWPPAFVAAIHLTYPCPWTLVPGIRPDAYWIWTDKYTVGDLVVYCRLNLDGRICPDRTLSVIADNALRVYIDGVKQSDLMNANGWTQADSVPFPCSTRVIAIHGTDEGVVRAGILASTEDDYVTTDASWKCTNRYYRGWEQVAYDDSSWPAAWVIASNQASPWGFIRGISAHASWIWTRNFVGGDRDVYCRYRTW